MGSTEDDSGSGGVAVWYFVGATFLFVGSAFFTSSPQNNVIAGVVGFVLAIAVFAAGMVVLRRELAQRRQ